MPKELQGKQVGVLHNTRCCIGGAVFHRGGAQEMIPEPVPGSL